MWAIILIVVVVLLAIWWFMTQNAKAGGAGENRPPVGPDRVRLARCACLRPSAQLD